MPLEASEPRSATDGDSQRSSWIAVDAPRDVGLAGLRQHLKRVVVQHGLHSLTVVVDDLDLGRQAFRAGTVDARPLGAGQGVMTDPATSDLDADVLVALCAASLRVDVLRDTTEATGELAIRRLPGVFAVEMEEDGDLTICRVHVDGDAPDDVGRVAARSLPPAAGSRLVVEVVRPQAAAAPDTASPTQSTPSLDPAPAASTAVTLLAVRSVPEDGEIEVHLGRGDIRAVGRAPLARGLAGAVEAVLTAATQVGALERWRPSWVRTVETTADGQFVVAAALTGPESGEHRHGIATGSSPIDAAARAAVGALF